MVLEANDRNKRKMWMTPKNIARKSLQSSHFITNNGVYIISDQTICLDKLKYESCFILTHVMSIKMDVPDTQVVLPVILGVL